MLVFNSDFSVHLTTRKQLALVACGRQSAATLSDKSTVPVWYPNKPTLPLLSRQSAGDPCPREEMTKIFQWKRTRHILNHLLEFRGRLMQDLWTNHRYFLFQFTRKFFGFYYWRCYYSLLTIIPLIVPIGQTISKEITYFEIWVEWIYPITSPSEWISLWMRIKQKYSPELSVRMIKYRHNLFLNCCVYGFHDSSNQKDPWRSPGLGPSRFSIWKRWKWTCSSWQCEYSQSSPCPPRPLTKSEVGHADLENTAGTESQ